MMRKGAQKLLLLGPAAYGALRLAGPWFNNWGATVEEKTMRVPGEEALENPRISATHAITIDAPPEEVWAWLIQIGVGRGGFYSYAWLENLVGCGVRNITRIDPALQNLKQGDTIMLHPKAPPLRVTRLEKNRVLALEGWIFYLRSLANKRTRLVVRGYRFNPPEQAHGMGALINALTRSVFFDFAHFIMERKQMLELKRLAEEHFHRGGYEPIKMTAQTN